MQRFLSDLMKRFQKLDRFAKLSVIVIILGFVLRVVYSMFLYPSSDGSYYLGISRFIARTGTFPVLEYLGREVFEKPPLLHMLCALAFRIFSVISENAGMIAMKMVSPLVSVVILVMTFKIARAYYNSKVSFFAVLFVALIPINLYYNSGAYMDTVFFAVSLLCVFFALKDKFWLTSIFSGLLLYTNQRAYFIFPVILYLMYKNNKGSFRMFVQKSALLICISVLMFSPWLVHNYMSLGNPVWPMLNPLFPDSYPEMVHPTTFKNLFLVSQYTGAYFEIFGLPAGNLQNFHMLNFPFLGLLIAAWILATLMYISPFVYGLFFVKKEFAHFSLWYAVPIIISNAVQLIVNQSFSFRYLLSTIFIIGVIWAIGIVKLQKKLKKLGNLFAACMIILMIVFTGSVLVVIKVSADAWKAYEDDFEWMRRNTESDSVIYASNVQEFTYILDRYSIPAADYSYKFDPAIMYKSDYVFRNDHFRPKDITFPDSIAALLEDKSDFKVVYNNSDTGTVIYKVIKKALV